MEFSQEEKRKYRYEDKRNHVRGPWEKLRKTAAVRIKDQKANKVITKTLPNGTKEELHGFIDNSVFLGKGLYRQS